MGGWGYDGVALFAPLPTLWNRRTTCGDFIRRAHALEHRRHPRRRLQPLRPDGNYLREYSEHYSQVHTPDCGDAITFDGEQTAGAGVLPRGNPPLDRGDHLDGFRFDASGERGPVPDRTSLPKIRESPRSVREVDYLTNEKSRRTHASSADSTKAGYGMDALWNDDFTDPPHSGPGRHYPAGERVTTADYWVSRRVHLGGEVWILYQGSAGGPLPWQKRRRGTYALICHRPRSLLSSRTTTRSANSGRGFRAPQDQVGHSKAITAAMC